MTMMDISILLLTILLFGHNKVVGENTTATAGDYTVEVLGQSGKINLKQVPTGKRILQVSPDSLDEYENAADTKVVSNTLSLLSYFTCDVSLLYEIKLGENIILIILLF